jgi:hypothetical protein
VVAKTLRVGEGAARRSPLRADGGLLHQFIYPAEPPLPQNSAVGSIRVAYEAASIDFLGWSVPWVVAYFILTLAFAAVLRKPLRVTL